MEKMMVLVWPSMTKMVKQLVEAKLPQGARMLRDDVPGLRLSSGQNREGNQVRSMSEPEHWPHLGTGGMCPHGQQGRCRWQNHDRPQIVDRPATPVLHKDANVRGRLAVDVVARARTPGRAGGLCWACPSWSTMKFRICGKRFDWLAVAGSLIFTMISRGGCTCDGQWFCGL